ncbi:MAG: N-acetylmuramoyl-L-alanine amidase [Gammaproteobacteria bacterium]
MSTPARAFDIALDIGHFTDQPGVTSASGIAEFELNRLLAHEVAGSLNRMNFSHRFIGDDGSMNILIERTAAALEARLFLSLHHDSVLPEWMPHAGEFSGYSLFVSRKNLKAEESLACARIIGKKLLLAGYRPSKYHATPVPGENRPFADERLGVHYFDDLVVLKTAQQPAVLIEAGVVVNPRDEKKVTGREARMRLAGAIASGARECLGLPKLR